MSARSPAPTHADPPFATPKGERQARRILDAAFRCLARDGYAATSMQRIADEAGVQKRMLHYYFESRERLFERVVEQVGQRLLGPLEETIADLEDPAEILTSGLERFWSEVVADPEPQAVYLALVAESVDSPSLRAAIARVSDRYRELILRSVEEARRRGWRFAIDERTLVVLVIASVQGLTIQYLERGVTDEFDAARRSFTRWLISLATPPSPRAPTS